MLGLIASQVLLLIAAALIGFAIGWRLRAAAHGLVAQAIERDLDDLRRRVGEAHVRQARGR